MEFVAEVQRRDDRGRPISDEAYMDAQLAGVSSYLRDHPEELARTQMRISSHRFLGEWAHLLTLAVWSAVLLMLLFGRPAVKNGVLLWLAISFAAWMILYGVAHFEGWWQRRSERRRGSVKVVGAEPFGPEDA